MEEIEYIISDQYDGKRRKLYKFLCIVCNKEKYAPKHVLYNKKYCSQKCMAEANKDRIKLKCDFCFDEFYRTKSKIKNSKSRLPIL